MGAGHDYLDEPAADVVRLNAGVSMPRVGLGVAALDSTRTESLVRDAIAAGYRLVDTAGSYGNEAAVGRAVRGCGLPREDLFVTTKLDHTDLGPRRALAAFDRSLELLDLEYVDLYLIHWPVPQRDLYVQTWGALSRLVAQGRVRAVGVSNFEPAHLARLTEEGFGVPAVNQVEVHPSFAQVGVRRANARLRVVTQSWSPLGQSRDLSSPVVKRVAEETGRSPAQVVVRWHLQHGLAVVVQTSRAERLHSNLDVFSFSLSADHLEAIDALDIGRRIGPSPQTWPDSWGGYR